VDKNTRTIHWRVTYVFLCWEFHETPKMKSAVMLLGYFLYQIACQSDYKSERKGKQNNYLMRFTTSFTSLFRFLWNFQMLSNNNWRSSVSNFHLIRARNAESTGIKSFALWSTSLRRFLKYQRLLDDILWKAFIPNFMKSLKPLQYLMLRSMATHSLGLHVRPSRFHH